MLKKYCKCGKLIPYGKRYCEKCQAEYDAALKIKCKESSKKYHKKYDKDDKYHKFYNSSVWRRLATSYAAKKKYKCELCGAIADEVHHKNPLKESDENWNNRFDENELELLCHRCHNNEHKRFNGGGGANFGRKMKNTQLPGG